MKMIKAFNKATKKFTDYFNYIEKELDKPTKELEESIYLINSHITLWQHDENYSDDDFLTVFAQKFKNKFIIYNITPRKLQVKTNQDKIKDLKSPDFSSYTLEYLMSFSIDVKKHLSANPDDVIIIHDDNQIGKIFSLLSCLLSYTVTVSNAPMPPLDAYYTITSLNDDFKNIASVFYNRMMDDMPLGSCVTSYYGVKKEMTEVLTYSDINNQNAYNTRGDNPVLFPIGPISAPGKKAIEAVIKPIKTNYYYFVSDKNHKLYFTKTLREHEQTINKLEQEGLWLQW